MARLTKAQKKQVREVLVAARKLIVRPLGWTQGHFSTTRRNRKNVDVDCYCAIGALEKVCPGYDTPTVDKLLLTQQVLGSQVPGFNPRLTDGFDAVVAFNDLTTTRKKDVIALFDAAIEKVSA